MSHFLISVDNLQPTKVLCSKRIFEAVCLQLKIYFPIEKAITDGMGLAG